MNKIGKIQFCVPKKNNKCKFDDKNLESLFQKYDINNKCDQILLFFSIYGLVCEYFLKLEYKNYKIKIDNKLIDLFSYEDNIFEELNKAIIFN